MTAMASLFWQMAPGLGGQGLGNPPHPFRLSAAMKIEGPRFSVWLAPDITVEERAEAAHALFRHLIDPPRSNAELRRITIRTAMAQYSGARSNRAKRLENDYRNYLASVWLRERDLETLPDPRSASRVFLHRLARLNRGRSLGWRQLFDIANCPQD
jgi:hypothetical protein